MRSCDCDFCTADGEEPPHPVSKCTWFRHQRYKRQRFLGARASSEGPAGTAEKSTETDDDQSLISPAGGSQEVRGVGGGETDSSPGSGRMGAAARSEDSLFHPDRDTDKSGGGGGDADRTPGPILTGAAARSEESLFRADRKPGKSDNESSAVSTDLKSLD